MGFCLVVWFAFERGSSCLVHAVKKKLTFYLKLSLSQWQPICQSLLSAGIAGVTHHDQQFSSFNNLSLGAPTLIYVVVFLFYYGLKY